MVCLDAPPLHTSGKSIKPNFPTTTSHTESDLQSGHSTFAEIWWFVGTLWLGIRLSLDKHNEARDIFQGGWGVALPNLIRGRGQKELQKMSSDLLRFLADGFPSSSNASGGGWGWGALSQLSEVDISFQRRFSPNICMRAKSKMKLSNFHFNLLLLLLLLLLLCKSKIPSVCHMDIVFRFHYDVLNRIFFIHRNKIFTFRHLLWLLFHTVQPYKIMIMISDLILLEMLMMVMRVLMIMMVMIMRVMMMTMMTNNLSCHLAVSQIWAPVRQLPRGQPYHQTIKNVIITQHSSDIPPPEQIILDFPLPKDSPMEVPRNRPA